MTSCSRCLDVTYSDAAVIVTEMQTLRSAWYQLKPELLTVSDTVICKQINDDDDDDDDDWSCHCGLALMTWPWSTGPSAVSSSQ